MRETDVLIVGGGPVGLTASVLMSRFGVSSLLVERHPSTSIHPKARGINARTMEIFRQCGVEDAVRAAGLPPERARFIVWARSLAGEELEPVTDYRPSARPGHRAAHAWIVREGIRQSTLDLFGSRFVLLAGPSGAAWCEAARAAAGVDGVALDALTAGAGGADARGGRWLDTWEIEPDGAALVRPDGQVAWRSRGAVPDAAAAMRRVLRRVLSLE